MLFLPDLSFVRLAYVSPSQRAARISFRPPRESCQEAPLSSRPQNVFPFRWRSRPAPIFLENPRWKDLAKFYEDEVFTKEDVDEVLNLPNIEFMNVIKKLPKGLAKTLHLRVATKIEDGTFDSLTKIKAIDETFGTDFMSILSH